MQHAMHLAFTMDMSVFQCTWPKVSTPYSLFDLLKRNSTSPCLKFITYAYATAADNDDDSDDVADALHKEVHFCAFLHVLSKETFHFIFDQVTNNTLELSFLLTYLMSM